MATFRGATRTNVGSGLWRKRRPNFNEGLDA